MDQMTWDTLSESEKSKVRSDAGLSDQLKGLEGKRVEVVTDYGETRRFYVGRSSGWVPCHIERKLATSRGGIGAHKHYASVRVIR
jgi:hypothetical protein